MTAEHVPPRNPLTWFKASSIFELIGTLLASLAMVVLSGYRHESAHHPLEEEGWERTNIDVPISVARHRANL